MGNRSSEKLNFTYFNNKIKKIYFKIVILLKSNFIMYPNFKF